MGQVMCQIPMAVQSERDLVVLVGYEWSSCRVVLREEQRKEVENRQARWVLLLFVCLFVCSSFLFYFFRGKNVRMLECPDGRFWQTEKMWEGGTGDLFGRKREGAPCVVF